MTTLVLTLRESLRYRGAIGQWSWLLHRLSGLGVVLFIVLHVVDTSWAVFYPPLYEEAIKTYQSPLFTLGEFALVASVVYHAFNGLRVAFFDYRPQLWRHQGRAAVGVLLLSGLLLTPVFVLMFGHVLDFYNEEAFVLPLEEVIRAQLPFLGGFALAGIAALLLAGLHSLVAGRGSQTALSASSERFWWLYMRISGVLILPLVFGHLGMMHVVQGVFDISAAEHLAVGASEGQVGVNATGTAVEFVHDRWSTFIGPLAIWRLYDFALLVLVVIHGFNGLRGVLWDYLHHPLAKRAALYLCLIAALVLLALGGGALVIGIDEAAIDEASRALCEIRQAHGATLEELVELGCEEFGETS
ncbi:MAG: succinate dehydrogenase, cytochrome b556 subunit [Anaerolineaceae bacterium]|nr:succinate dehydrogenase, cytochrome b556 subunit [Anaerolineaceae bacterium]MCY3936346.1 succinate dehydrogenase, cytochrome b556 subunit [Chloroflexota bacterium]